MDANDALVLSRRLWQRIQLQRYGTGVDEPQGAPRGLHGYLDYYRGKHALRFASDEFAEHHLGRYAGFTDNWCAPVIDATAERLNALGIRLGDDTREADKDFQRVMDANDADRGLSEAYTVAMAAGRSYGRVWGNPDDENTPCVSFEHPEFCAIAYDPDSRQSTADAKAWTEDGKGFLTMSTDAELWKWQWSVPPDNDPRRPVEWEPRIGEKDDTWPIPNPMGVPTMVEFRNSSLLDDRPISDLSGVAAMQDAVNLVWAYLFNALDFATMDQRVVTGAEFPKVPILDADGQQIGDKPADLKKMIKDRVLWLTGDNAKIDAWPAAALDVFTNVVSLCVDHIAAQTRTPPHYLVGKMANMAAEALTVAETGLVAKAAQRQINFTRPQREIYRRIALAQGDTARAEQARTGKIVWEDPQYRSLGQKTDAFLKLAQGGLPLQWRLEWYGLNPADIDRVMKMAREDPTILVAPTPEKLPPGQAAPRGYSYTSQNESSNGAMPSAPAMPAMPAPGNPGQ